MCFVSTALCLLSPAHNGYMRCCFFLQENEDLLSTSSYEGFVARKHYAMCLSPRPITSLGPGKHGGEFVCQVARVCVCVCVSSQFWNQLHIWLSRSIIMTIVTIWF